MHASRPVNRNRSENDRQQGQDSNSVPPRSAKKDANRYPLVNKEKIGSSCLARILRLTILLAPYFIEAILDGRRPKGLALVDFMEAVPDRVGGAVAAVRVFGLLANQTQRQCRALCSNLSISASPTTNQALITA